MDHNDSEERHINLCTENNSTQDIVESVKARLLEEGREARNLIAYSLPLQEKKSYSCSVHTEKINKAGLQHKEIKKLSPDVCHFKQDKRQRSASAGRDPQASLRARHWGFLFRNLEQAVDEIYQTCEADESIIECKEAILMLERYANDFSKFIEWLKIKWEYESTPPPQRPTSLAWEIRTSSPAKILRVCRKSNILDAKRVLNFNATIAGKMDGTILHPALRGGRKETSFRNPSIIVHPTDIRDQDLQNQSAETFSHRNISGDISLVHNKLEMPISNCRIDEEPLNVHNELKPSAVKDPSSDLCEQSVAADISNYSLPDFKIPVVPVTAQESLPNTKILLVCTATKETLPISETPVVFSSVKESLSGSSTLVVDASTKDITEAKGHIVSKDSSTISTKISKEIEGCKVPNESQSPRNLAKHSSVGKDAGDSSCKESVSSKIFASKDEVSKKISTVVDGGVEWRGTKDLIPALETSKAIKSDNKRITEAQIVKNNQVRPGPLVYMNKASQVRKAFNQNRTPMRSASTGAWNTFYTVNQTSSRGNHFRNQPRASLVRSSTTLEGSVINRKYSYGKKIHETSLAVVNEKYPSSSSLASSTNTSSSGQSWADKLKGGTTAETHNSVSSLSLQDDDEGWEVVKRGRRSHGGSSASLNSQTPPGSAKSVPVNSSSSKINNKDREFRVRNRFHQPSSASSMPSLSTSQANKLDADREVKAKVASNKSLKKTPIKHSGQSRFEANAKCTDEVMKSANDDQRAKLSSETAAVKSRYLVSEAPSTIYKEQKADSSVRNPAATEKRKKDASNISKRDSHLANMKGNQEGISPSPKMSWDGRNNKVIEESFSNRIDEHSRAEDKAPIHDTSVVGGLTNYVVGCNRNSLKGTVVSLGTSNLPVAAQEDNLICLPKAGDNSVSNGKLDAGRSMEVNAEVQIQMSHETPGSAVNEEKQVTRGMRIKIVDVCADADEDVNNEVMAISESLIAADKTDITDELFYDYDPIYSKLSAMSWAEEMDAIDCIEALRPPGRVLHIHEKLSSPSRKLPISEKFRRHQEKLAKAQELRGKLIQAKTEKLKDLFRKIDEVQTDKERLLMEKRDLFERKMERAEEKRRSHLQEIVNKAHDEENKAKEIAFINGLEAQNKLHDILQQHQSHESRLADRAEERCRKLEEKAAKEAAAQERRKALEAERQARMAELCEKRRKRWERIDRQQAERREELLEQAREKARDREERLSALQQAQLAKESELVKKIQQKQQETARRHEENIEQIRQRALESSIRKFSQGCDDAPKLLRYETKKLCTLCNCLIASEVYLLSHLRGKNHQEALNRLHKSDVTLEESETYNLKFIVDAPANIDDPQVTRDKERQKALKKRCRKLRTRMATRGKEFLKSYQTSTSKETPFKIRLRKAMGHISKLFSNQGSGPWPISDVATLDKHLLELLRLLETPDTEGQTAFASLNGFQRLFSLLGLITSSEEDVQPCIIPSKSLSYCARVIFAACRDSLSNCQFVLFSNMTGEMVDFLVRRFNQISSEMNENGSITLVPSDSAAAALMELLAEVLKVLSSQKLTDAEPEASFELRLQDVVSYCVSMGVADKISWYFSHIQNPVDNDAPSAQVILAAMSLLSTLAVTVSGRCKTGDPTQLIGTFHVMEACGVVSLMYSLLLHQGGRSSSPPPDGLLSPSTLAISEAATTFLHNLAELDLHMFQAVLGSEGISLEFRHISSFLLWYCSHWPSEDILHNIISLVGFFTIDNKENQMVIQSGETPSVLQQLCSLPWQYFSEPRLTRILFPTLLACCLNNEDNINILQQDMSFQVLEDFLRSKEAADHILMQILQKNK